LSCFWKMMSGTEQPVVTDAVRGSLNRVMEVLNRFVQGCPSPSRKRWLMLQRGTCMLNGLPTGFCISKLYRKCFRA
jgi:hypothetical protein